MRGIARSNTRNDFFPVQRFNDSTNHVATARHLSELCVLALYERWIKREPNVRREGPFIAPTKSESLVDDLGPDETHSGKHCRLADSLTARTVSASAKNRESNEMSGANGSRLERLGLLSARKLILLIP